MNTPLLAKLCSAIYFSCLMVMAACQPPQSMEEGPGLQFRVALELRPETKIWEAANLFAKEIQKASPEHDIREGEIEVSFYDQGSIGTERQLLEACYLGVVEVVQVNSSVVTTVEPSYSILDLPYLFVSEAHHENVLQGEIGSEMLQQLEAHNMLGLGFYAAGFRDMFYKTSEGKNCVEIPEDLAGLKIRVMESPVMIGAINAMGATATPIPFSELYQALKTGVVDGAENSPKVFVSSNYEETGCNCFTLTEHFTNQHVLIANADWLKGLEPKYQQRISEVAREIMPTFDRLWEEATRESYAKMKEAGVTVNKVKEKQAFIEQVDQISEQFFRDYPQVSEELYLKIKEQAQNYR